MLSQVHIRRAYFSFCLLGIRHSKVTIIFIKRYFPISTRLICRSRTSSRDQRHIIIVVMCYFVYYLYFVRLCGIFQICGIQIWQPLGCGKGGFLVQVPLGQLGVWELEYMRSTPHCITTFLIFATTGRWRVHKLFLPIFNLIHPHFPRLSDHRQLFWFFTDLLPRYVQ